MAHLLVIMPDRSNSTITLGDRPIIIGREFGCDIRLEQESASRRHARIVPVEHGYRIEDLGSVNGTWVNSRRVESAMLRSGDRLAIQDFEALFIDDNPASRVTLSDLGTVRLHSRGGAQETLELSHRRLKSLYDLTSRLTALRDIPALLDDALTICCDTLGFERGAVGLRKGPRQGLDWPVVRNLRGADGGLTLSRTMLRRALEDGERLIYRGEDDEFIATQSMVDFKICAAMCVPLVYEGEVLGVIYGDRVNLGRTYTDEDSDFFFALACQVSVGLANARLLEEHKQHLRLEQEIALARETQQLLFPKSLPQGGKAQFAAVNVPGRHISGDHYDVLPLSGDAFALLVADVTGKGIAASLLGGSLHGTIRATMTDACDPAELLALWNEVICGVTDGMRFVTCVLLRLDAAARRATVAVAGHPPPMILVPGESRPLNVQVAVGMPLGVQENHRYANTTIDLPPGPCTLLLYSDGVTEAKNTARDEFGDDRLIVTAMAAADQPPQELLARIERDVRAFAGDCPQYDDITMVAARLA